MISERSNTSNSFLSFARTCSESLGIQRHAKTYHQLTTYQPPTQLPRPSTKPHPPHHHLHHQHPTHHQHQLSKPHPPHHHLHHRHPTHHQHLSIPATFLLCCGRWFSRAPFPLPRPTPIASIIVPPTTSQTPTTCPTQKVLLALKQNEERRRPVPPSTTLKPTVSSFKRCSARVLLGTCIVLGSFRGRIVWSWRTVNPFVCRVIEWPSNACRN